MDEKNIELLREKMEKRLSGKRFSHTLGVERAADRLADLCGEDRILARCAALLHDVSKEYSDREQLELLALLKKELDSEDALCPQIWHSYTARYIIERDFPEFATQKLLSAIEKHTVGAEDMSVLDQSVFLADFIEDTRVYEASNALRQFVFSKMKQGCKEENVKVLQKSVIKAIDYTVSHLEKTERIINSKTLLTKNSLLGKI